MKPEDLNKSYNFIVDCLVEWAKAVGHPLRTALNITANAENPAEVFKSATKLWFITFLINSIIQIPLFQLNGISWSNVGFHLSTGLVLFSLVLNANFGIYIGFRFFRIGVTFTDLYVFYTVIVAIFSPLFTIFGYPQILKLVTAIKNLKASEGELTAIGLYKSIQSVSGSPVFVLYQAVSGLIMVMLTFGMLTCIIHALSAKSGVAKYRLINALTFGTIIISSLPAFILTAFYYFALYAFL